MPNDNPKPGDVWIKDGDPWLISDVVNDVICCRTERQPYAAILIEAWLAWSATAERVWPKPAASEPREGTKDDFVVGLMAAAEDAKNYEPCAALSISEEGLSVELILDTAANYYGEWIPGEGGDICLYRDQETKKVVGAHLPLMRRNLCVHHDGPIRINAGFKKTDCDYATIPATVAAAGEKKELKQGEA